MKSTAWELEVEFQRDIRYVTASVQMDEGPYVLVVFADEKKPFEMSVSAERDRLIAKAKSVFLAVGSDRQLSSEFTWPQGELLPPQ